MKNIKYILAVFLFFFIPITLVAVPNQIRFQGRLTDKQGAPIIGTPQVTFDIFNTVSGGSSLWSSGPLTVTTNDAGLFATELGPITASIFSQNPNLYLQVTVQGTAGPQILSPRQKLSSVPYALETEHAVSADVAASVTDNAITSAKIQDGAIQNVDLSTDSVDSLNIKDGGVGSVDLAVDSVRSANIEDGSIQWVDLSTGAVRTENIADGSVEGVDVATDAITTAHFLDGTIQNNDMADGIVDTVKLADVSVTTVKITTGAVTRDRIQDLAVDSSKIESVDVSKLAGQINDSQIQDVDVSKILNITGIVVAFGGTSAPSGWLMCNGVAVSRTTYSNLFGVIGTSFGSGDGSTTFNLPDFRGRFLRGVDGSAGNDPNNGARLSMAGGGNSGNNVGSVQSDALVSHGHAISDPGHRHPIWGDIFNSTVGGGVFPTSAAQGFENWVYTESATTGITVQNSGGNETRPKNAYVNYIIKN